MSDVPGPVDDAITFWRRGHGQRPVAWSETVWRKYFDGYTVFEKLPNPLDRQDVIELSRHVKDEESVVDAFIASMVWGFGLVGYGAWRTSRILNDPNASRRLLTIHNATTAGGGPAGFEAMAEHRLRHLGVAFGTKFLFFAAEAAKASPPAPVLDRVVRAWLAENVGLRLDIWSWRRPQDYALYCNKLYEWGAARGLSAGQVEEAIFEYALHGPDARKAQPRRVENLLEELSELAERSNLSNEDKVAFSEYLERIGELLDED